MKINELKNKNVRKPFLAGLSGLLLFFSFPMYGNGIVAWAALIPLFFALKDATPRAGFRIGFLTGIVAHVGIFYWIVYVVVHYGYLPVYAGVAAMLLLAAYLSVYTACFAMGVVFLKRRGIPLFLSAPLLWTVLEYLRAHLMTGFPWANLAYSQYLFTKAIQIADVTGIYGVTCAVVLINAVLYDLLSAKLVTQANKHMHCHAGPDPASSPILDSRFRGNDNFDICCSRSNKMWRLWVEAVLAGLVITAILVYGHVRTAEIDAAAKQAPGLQVALVQGNIEQSVKWDPLYQSQTIDIYSALSRESIPSGNGLIVWPETAAPFYFQQPGPLQEAVVNLAKASGSAILFGSPSYEEEKTTTHYMNSAYLLGPDGTLGGRYDKVHLVPYGEYVPLRRLFPFIGKLVVGVGDFRAGRGYYPLTAAGRRLGVLICYEGIFPEAARDYKKEKVELLVNITNDAWFGQTSAPRQHLSMTVFRAIENRLYLVRAANTGISAIIDAKGEIVSRTGLFERAVLKGDVKIIDENTCYTAYGDAFVYLCVIVLLIITISTRQRRRKHV